MKVPMLIPINPECLSALRESDIKARDMKENSCCEAIKKADYLVLPSIGIAHINLNFCPCCGRKLKR